MTEENTVERNGPVKSFAEAFTPRLVDALRRNYSLADLKADASAGFSVAVVSLPLAMALAVASGVSPASGLVTAIVGGFITSLLGGSRYQIGGPATAFVALMAKTVENHGFEGLLAATVMAGLILLALGYMRLGAYIKYLPHSVPVGFTAGVAVILLTSQARDFLGLQIARLPSGFLPKLEAISAHLTAIHYQSLLLASATLGFIIYQRKLKPRYAGMMTTIAVCSAVTWLLGLQVDTIGSRYGGIPHAVLTAFIPSVSFATLLELTPTAIAIAMLGAIKSLLSAVVADGITSERHNSNAELVAQGWANLFAGFFGGIAQPAPDAHCHQYSRRGKKPTRGCLVRAISPRLRFCRRAACLAYSAADTRCNPYRYGLGHDRPKGRSLDPQERQRRNHPSCRHFSADLVSRRDGGHSRWRFFRLPFVHAPHGGIRGMADSGRPTPRA